MTYEEHKAAVEAAAKAFYEAVENAEQLDMEVIYNIKFFWQKFIIYKKSQKECWDVVVRYKGNDKYNAEVQSYTMHRIIREAGDNLVSALIASAKDNFIFRASKENVINAFPSIE